ncbi:hypothetical protein FRB90_004890, partial [Tulasnella sp. 427]
TEMGVFLFRTVLRLLADGKVLWAFEPPLSSDNVTSPSQDEGDGRGIWITDVSGKDPTSSGDEDDEDKEEESSDDQPEDEDQLEDERSGDEDQDGEEDAEHEDDEDEDADGREEDHPSQGQTLRLGGKFGALALEEDESES